MKKPTQFYSKRSKSKQSRSIRFWGSNCRSIGSGIGFSELVAFHTAVIRWADSANIPMESAAYRVMEEIENYEIAPLAGTVGGGSFIGFVAGYAIKKVIKLAAVIIGFFIAAVAYLGYQLIVNVDWNRIQAISQNGITWVTDAISHISGMIGTTHSVSHIGIPLASSASNVWQ